MKASGSSILFNTVLLLLLVPGLLGFCASELIKLQEQKQGIQAELQACFEENERLKARIEELEETLTGTQAEAQETSNQLAREKERAVLLDAEKADLAEQLISMGATVQVLENANGELRLQLATPVWQQASASTEQPVSQDSEQNALPAAAQLGGWLMIGSIAGSGGLLALQRAWASREKNRTRGRQLAPGMVVVMMTREQASLYARCVRRLQG